MRPGDYPYQHESLLTIWHAFHNAPNHNGSTPAGIDPIVYESWQRCRMLFTGEQFNLKHHSPRSRSNARQEEHSNLISVTLPYLEDIHQLTEGTTSIVFLTDHNGTILDIEGDPTSVRLLQPLGLGIGENWEESRIGTNAVGLSLLTAMPMQVVGAEHYFQIYHRCGVSAAPIHNDRGEIVGTVGIITTAEQITLSHLALVMATARAITNQLQSDLILEQANQRLKKLDTILESVTDGVITWNNSGIVEHMNSMACQILGIRRSAFLGKSLNAILGLSPRIQDAILRRENVSDAETSLQIGDRVVKCMMTIRTIQENQHTVTGGIAMLRPLSQVRSLINQQTSPYASLRFDDFHSESHPMRAVLKQAQVAARGSAPVLLVGEDGVGKTALAQAIHNASPRANKPLVVVNCRMIPSEFIPNELLGIEGFGSDLGRPSKFELADGGTILFDQIDQLTLEGQTILQQVIHSRHIIRIQSSRATPLNVRVIATTPHNIENLVESGRFLPQLYYLFNAFMLHIPPLRGRHEDIGLLVQRFLMRSAGGVGHVIEPDAMDALRRYPWPGNIRELESVLERAMMHAEENTIRTIDLPENIRTQHSWPPDSTLPKPIVSLEEAEREAIITSGWAYNGVVSEMAAALGINRSTLWRKMKQYGIRAEDFKS